MQPSAKDAAQRFLVPLRRLTLPIMAGSLILYIVAHPPLRDFIITLLKLLVTHCFTCREPLTRNLIVQSLTALFLMTAASLAACSAISWHVWPSYERPLVFGLSVLALIVAPAATIGGIASWSNTALLRPPTGPLLTAIPAIALIAISAYRGWRPHRPRLTTGNFGGSILLVWILALALLITSTIVSLLHPPTGYDALGYHAPLAVYLWRDGNLTTFLTRFPGYWPLAHPATAELWYGLLLTAGGERLANLGQLPFAILGSMSVRTIARRMGFGEGSALLAAGSFLLSPLVIIQTGMQLNDLTGAALFMATLPIACAPVADWRPTRLALLGIGLGLAATTKLALLPGVAGIWAFLIGTILRQDLQRKDVRMASVALSVVLLSFFVIVIPWWARGLVHYGNPFYPAALPLIGRGVHQTDSPMKDSEFVPHIMTWPLYPLFERHDDQSGFGGLFVVGALPGLVFAVVRSHRQPILLFLIVTAFMLPAWWVLTRHEPRFLLALFGVGFAFLPWSLLAVPRGWRQEGNVLLAIAAIFSALVTCNPALLSDARQPTERTEFYDRVWGVDPVVSSLPENEGLLLHTGLARSTYPAFYPLLGSSHTRNLIVVDGDIPTDMIVEKMRSTSVRYAYITASQEARSVAETTYDNLNFDLMHVSLIEEGWRSGTRRYLYRLR